ncbi:MAG TPA: sugar ABC transporter substrate-binding protein [Acidimicrobiales bacterium]|nr:sugar ABC transporter substrate-binding protein [Acidimicrobiales bacterium]
MRHSKTNKHFMPVAGAVVAAGSLLVASACSTSATPKVARGAKAPQTVKFKWGTFHLASRIESKIKAHKPLVMDLSFQALSEPGAPALLRAGLQRGAAWAKHRYGVTIKVNLIGTPETDPPSQISQIQSLVSAGQVDCVGVEPVTPGAFLKVINTTMQSGVPVMTVNTDSPASHRIAYYGVNDTAPSGRFFTGKIAGDFTVAWARAHKVKLTSAALITGDTTASWAQGRMQGWLSTVKKAFPKMSVVGTPTNAFTTGYDPAQINSKMSAFMTGHPNVQFYFDSDWGAAVIAQLIGSRHLKGKVYTLGFNVDSTYLKDLQQGTLIGTIDQRYDLQAENFVKGCAQFLLGGVVPKTPFQYLNPSIWTPANVAKAIKLYNSIPGALG